jgi:hypothetical protein
MLKKILPTSISLFSPFLKNEIITQKMIVIGQ